MLLLHMQFFFSGRFSGDSISRCLVDFPFILFINITSSAMCPVVVKYIHNSFKKNKDITISFITIILEILMGFTFKT